MRLPIRKLALGGGGAKGILHIGVLQELAKHQSLIFPDGIYGSSAGSIIASCIAFDVPIDMVLNFINKNSSIQSVIPAKFDIQNVSKLFSNKGLYNMDVFTERMIALFKSAGIDIQHKKLRDAGMPLYIVSSNITKGIPTIFSDDVLVLDALRCSCCIPFMFQPQKMGDSLYVDGDILTPNLTSICSEDTFVVNLDKQRKSGITLSQLESISALDYAKELYLIVSSHNQKLQTSKNTLSLSYPNLYSDSELSDFDIDELLRYSGDKFRGFFSSQILS